MPVKSQDTHNTFAVWSLQDLSISKRATSRKVEPAALSKPNTIKERVRTAKTLHPQIAPNHPAYAHQ